MDAEYFSELLFVWVDEKIHFEDLDPQDAVYALRDAIEQIHRHYGTE